MLTFDVQVTGSQIGRELTNDDEELAYCLAELSQNLDETDIDNVFYYLSDDQQAALGKLAALISQRAAWPK